MGRILTASLGAGRVSGHRTIGAIPGGDQRPGQQDVSVPGGAVRGAAAGNGAWSFTVAGAGIGWFRAMAPNRLRRDARRTSPADGRIDAGLPTKPSATVRAWCGT